MLNRCSMYDGIYRLAFLRSLTRLQLPLIFIGHYLMSWLTLVRTLESFCKTAHTPLVLQQHRRRVRLQGQG